MSSLFNSEYTDILIKALENGVISHKDISSSFLTYFSEDEIRDFVRSDFFYLLEEESNEDEDFTYCETCNEKHSNFIHLCYSASTQEIYGCPKCDDKCIFCG